MSHLGIAVGPVAAPVRPPEGGFPSQIPWFQTSQPGPVAQPLRPELSAALFPDYLDAARAGPSVSGNGGDPLPTASVPTARSAVVSASPGSAAWLPAYLTSTDSEGGNSAGAVRGVLVSPTKGSAQSLSDGSSEASTDFVDVPVVTGEAFFAADDGVELRADDLTRAISGFVPGNREKATHFAGDFVTADVSQKTADSGQRGAAAPYADHLFAALGSQTSSEGREDHSPPHAVPWRQWLILLTVVAGEAFNSQGPSRPPSRRQEHFSRLRVRSDEDPC
jgi:hypothetical protein